MNDRLSPAEVAAVSAMIEAVAEAIQALGQVPAGEFYVRVMQHFTVQQFERVITLLVAGPREARRVAPAHLDRPEEGVRP